MTLTNCVAAGLSGVFVPLISLLQCHIHVDREQHRGQYLDCHCPKDMIQEAVSLTLLLANLHLLIVCLLFKIQLSKQSFIFTARLIPDGSST